MNGTGAIGKNDHVFFLRNFPHGFSAHLKIEFYDNFKIYIKNQLQHFIRLSETNKMTTKFCALHSFLFPGKATHFLALENDAEKIGVNRSSFAPENQIVFTASKVFPSAKDLVFVPL